MRRIDPARTRIRPRAGRALVLFVLAVPTLLGMVGLVLDSGLLMAGQRAAQNAADAGALAAAMELMRGSSGTASSTATTFVQTYNGLSNANVTVNVPPASGSYSGVSNYVEVVVSVPFATSFIQVLGVNPSQTVSARAVAGFEPIAAGEGAIVLNPNAVPGITLNGNGSRLVVNGGITVNSMGGGVDQYGGMVTSSLGSNTYAFRTQTTTQNPAPVAATAIWVAGGIDTIDNFRYYNGPTSPNYDSSNTDRPVFANLQTTAPDPLISLPTPTTSNGVVYVQTYPKFLGGNNQWSTTANSPQNFNVGNGDTAVFPSGGGIYGNVNITGGTVTLNPGIYSSITMNGGTVTMNSGIYVLNAANLTGANAQSFSVGNGTTLTGSGVMIYNTGSDYNPTTGSPDSNDGSSSPNPPNSTQFGKVSINGGTVGGPGVPGPTNLFTGSTSGTFSGILFYQRRWNTQDASVGGNSNNIYLGGTIYDKWGNFTLAGQGQYNAEFVVGSLTISGGAAVTINATGKYAGQNNQVYLVE